MLYILGCCHLPENFNTRPSPVRNMYFEGPQNINQMRSLFMEKGEVCSSFLQKELKHYSIILIILIIIIAPRQLGNHPMQLELHSSAFKNSNLSIYRYISTTEGETRWDSVNQVLGSTFLLLFF